MAATGLEKMVAYLKISKYLKSKNVEEALLKVDRKHFIPRELHDEAYSDIALPIGLGQTISAPTVVTFMLEKLEIKKGMKILEIGTGSGYNTALLAELVGKEGKVFTIEDVEELVDVAKKNVMSFKEEYLNVTYIFGDGSGGYPEEAPFDRIIVTAGMPVLDDDHPLILQLKKDGKLIAPVGSRISQNLILYDAKNKSYQTVLPVTFVPLIGEFGFPP